MPLPLRTFLKLILMYNISENFMICRYPYRFRDFVGNLSAAFPLANLSKKLESRRGDESG